jgi:flagellar biosynthesis protein FlhA
MPNTYAIRVRDEIVGEGVLRLDRLVAVADPSVLARIAGEETREPVYGLHAKWIAFDERGAVEALGALAFDAVSIVGSHVAEIARDRAADLLGRQEMHTLVEHLRASSPALVKDIGSDVLPIATVHRAFLMLLRERTWPRDAHRTLEAMLDAAQHSREPRDLVEAARRAIVPGLVRRAGTQKLHALLVAPSFEETLVRALGAGGAPDPHLAVHVRDAIAAHAGDGRPVLVCSSALRPLLADLLDRFAIGADVYAFAELPHEVAVVALGTIADRPSAAVGA